MNYKAKNIDTDRALEAIESSRQFQERASMLKIEKERSFQEGVNKGLDIAEELFRYSNYEKKEEPNYVDGVLDALYELGKELDIPIQDIIDNFSSVDEACAELVSKIRNRFN